MGKITLVLPDDTENELRSRALKKGDLGKIADIALTRYFKETPR